MAIFGAYVAILTQDDALIARIAFYKWICTPSAVLGLTKAMTVNDASFLFWLLLPAFTFLGLYRAKTHLAFYRDPNAYDVIGNIPANGAVAVTFIGISLYGGPVLGMICFCLCTIWAITDFVISAKANTDAVFAKTLASAVIILPRPCLTFFARIDPNVRSFIDDKYM